MYRNILIATDGSQLAESAVSHGVSLAKLAGAKVTALIVEASFNVYGVPESQVRQMPEAFAQHAKHNKEHATKVLNLSSDHQNGRGQGLRSYRHGFAWPKRHFSSPARQRHQQGINAHQNSRARVPLRPPGR